MIQGILPYEFDNRYADKQPDTESYLAFIRDQTLLLKDTGQSIIFPQFKQIPDCRLETTYLFSISEYKFFLVDKQYTEDDTSVMSATVTVLLNDGYQFYHTSTIIPILRERSPKWLCFAGATAYQLGSWYQNNRYCGKCGGLFQKGSHERLLCCGSCKHTIYPKIQPAVIVAVTHNDRILLTKYADTQHSKRYALIAGFAEIGEAIEETVRREVMEESGIKVKNIRYYKSQPWAFSDTLLLGFFCELDGSEEITIDSHELSVAKWVTRDKLPSEQDDISLTYEMIRIFKMGQ